MPLVIVQRTIHFLSAHCLHLCLNVGFPVQNAFRIRPFPHQRRHSGEWIYGWDQELPGREVHPPCPNEEWWEHCHSSMSTTPIRLGPVRVLVQHYVMSCRTRTANSSWLEHHCLVMFLVYRLINPWCGGFVQCFTLSSGFNVCCRNAVWFTTYCLFFFLIVNTVKLPIFPSCISLL